jgi:hypothetical protein
MQKKSVLPVPGSCGSDGVLPLPCTSSGGGVGATTRFSTATSVFEKESSCDAICA